MSIIKVIALNDDLHERTYITSGSYYPTCVEFAKSQLLKPHTDIYEVREVYSFDPQGVLSTLTPEEFERVFNLLDQDPVRLFERDPKAWEERNAIFELFWENGEDWEHA